MVHTFHIDDSNNNAKALMEYLRKLEFVKEVEADWADDLPKEVENEILEAINQIDEGKSIPHDQVRAKHQKRFPHLKL